MFRRMRLQLTAMCALGTAAVLIGMAFVSLRFSLTQLERQSLEAFRSSFSAILLHLRSQPVIDQNWLAQTEAEGTLWIRVESKDAQLQYTRQNPERSALTEQAIRYAESHLGFVPFTPAAGGAESQPLLFELALEDARYLAGVAALSLENGKLNVTVVKDRKPEDMAFLWLTLGFGGLAGVSVLLLVAFSWFFSGRAARPVETYHKKQTDFLSAASHELRTPLAVIQMSAGTIRRLPKHAQPMAEKIESECGRMARLISDLSLLSSSGGSQWGLHRAQASPRDILQFTLERFEALASQRGIALEARLPEASSTLFCDRQRIEQVLTILMDNALRFTPSGGKILLRGDFHRSALVFSVADSGSGIPDAQKARVFDRFYKADASRHEKDHFGLGLSIAHEIMALHGGSISVQDSALGGAEFLLRLKAQPAALETI